MHVYENATANSNGTLASDGGFLRHEGQIFFADDIENQVLATSDYLNNPHTRTTNSEVRLKYQSFGVGKIKPWKEKAEFDIIRIAWSEN